MCTHTYTYNTTHAHITFTHTYTHAQTEANLLREQVANGFLTTRHTCTLVRISHRTSPKHIELATRIVAAADLMVLMPQDDVDDDALALSTDGDGRWC